MTFINLKKQANVSPTIVRNLHRTSHIFMNEDPYKGFLDYFERYSSTRLCAATGGVHITPIQVFWGVYKKSKGVDSSKQVYDSTNYRHVRTEMIGNGVLGAPDLILPGSGLLIDKLAAKLLTKKQYFIYICSGSSSTKRKIMLKQDKLIHMAEFSGTGCTFLDIRTSLASGAAKLKKYVSYL